MELLIMLICLSLIALLAEFMAAVILSDELPFVMLRWLLIAVFFFFCFTQTGHDILMNTHH
jgi:hypothetical protein